MAPREKYANRENTMRRTGYDLQKCWQHFIRDERAFPSAY